MTEHQHDPTGPDSEPGAPDGDNTYDPAQDDTEHDTSASAGRVRDAAPDEDPFDAEAGKHKGDPAPEDVDEDPTVSAAGGDDSPDAAPDTETPDDDEH